MTIDQRTSEKPDVYGTISKSLAISTVRCLLSYVIFPFVLPSIALIREFEPVIGIAIGIIAIVFNIRAMRQLFATSHRYRWYFSAISISIIALLIVLIVRDIMALT
jgi:ABC-type iron transport system FetAB permease component